MHELLTIENNRVDLRALGSKARCVALCASVPGGEPAHAHPADCEGEPGTRAVGRAGCLFPRADVQQLRCGAPRRLQRGADGTRGAGDLGVSIKSMVDEFQAASKSNQNIQSIADMQRFIENYPEFRAKSGNVSKHVTLMGEMGRLVDERHLMQVSQVEQARVSCGLLRDDLVSLNAARPAGSCMRHRGPQHRVHRGARAGGEHRGAWTEWRFSPRCISQVTF